jgi:hypothetical protein
LRGQAPALFSPFDHPFEFGRNPHRHVSGLDAAQNAIDSPPLLATTDEISNKLRHFRFGTKRIFQGRATSDRRGKADIAVTARYGR